MCGIAGFASKNFDRQDLKKMTELLVHRGPDAAGYFYNMEKGIGLGHRRLSIIDLSSAANQPFYSSDGRYVMVYNGEVYNFNEIASKYKVDQQTSSDSEVIIEAFKKAGISCISDLNGMFSIAIWDIVEEKLFLIRDRIGIKPLYYYNGENRFAFASELKALFSLGMEKAIDRNALGNFLYLGYLPGESTIYESFKKLLPGHYAIYYKGKLEINTFWSLQEQLDSKTIVNESDTKATLKGLVESSVQYCMISDVPVGIFLSGGVDSSLVAAAAQKTSSLPIKTFSIGFKEEKYNEVRFARDVANHIGSEHHEFIVTENEALELVDTLLDVYDEPYADSSAIPTLLVSKLARQHVTVALSGDGGDELFMGYGFYNWARRLSNPLIKHFRKGISATLYRLGNNRMQRGSMMFDYPKPERIKSHIFSQEQCFFNEREIGELLTSPSVISIKEEIMQKSRKLSPVEEQSFFDILNYLPEDLLVKTDRASMRHSLEVRVPLLDHRIVEFAINLGEELKLKGKTGKYLLKEVLYDYIPPRYFDRPKWGFAIPLRMWLSGQLRYLLDKYLSDQVIEECNLVNVRKVRNLKQDFFCGKDYLYNRLWVLIILHKWYKEKHA